MRIAILTEIQHTGKFPRNFPNARTEIAWMIALDADHFFIRDYRNVAGYDWVMLILPKGGVSLNVEGIRLNNEKNRFSDLYASNFIEVLKKNNKKIGFIQEGPTNYVNDFSVLDQFNYYNQLAECDIIFAHNEYDTNWYKGWFPDKMVTVIPTLMIEELIQSISPTKENKTMIGGNQCRWYGGFQSYLVANEFDNPIYVQTSHCLQPGEDQIPNLHVLPRLAWLDWIKELSTFKYAVHLMPTVAAGTFSLNCAYLGIPCIGNIDVDTQKICHPELAVRSENVKKARELAIKLRNDDDFYNKCSIESKNKYNKYFSLDKWKEKVYPYLK